MKRCVRCGKEYSDEVTICPEDGEPLASPHKGRASKLAVFSMVLGIFYIIIFWNIFEAPIEWDKIPMGILCGLLSGVLVVIFAHAAQSRIRRFPLQKSGSGYVLTGLIAGYAGILVFSITPFILPKAREKAMRTKCAFNLKQVGIAVNLWSGDNDGVLPKNFMEMTNELVDQRELLCPADLIHKARSEWTTHHWYELPIYTGRRWDPTNVSYEFLTPGIALNNLSNQVIVRCPIHGLELLGNGTVRDGQLKAKN